MGRNCSQINTNDCCLKGYQCVWLKKRQSPMLLSGDLLHKRVGKFSTTYLSVGYTKFRETGVRYLHKAIKILKCLFKCSITQSQKLLFLISALTKLTTYIILVINIHVYHCYN